MKEICTCPNCGSHKTLVQGSIGHDVYLTCGNLCGYFVSVGLEWCSIEDFIRAYNEDKGDVEEPMPF